MQTLTEFQITRGILTETYSVDLDHDGVCLRNVLDDGGYCDTLHIDPQALRPIAAALLAAARDVPERAGPAVVVQFPTRVRTRELESLFIDPVVRVDGDVVTLGGR
jgi:hypothetical protein